VQPIFSNHEKCQRIKLTEYWGRLLFQSTKPVAEEEDKRVYLLFDMEFFQQKGIFSQPDCIIGGKLYGPQLRENK